MRSRVRRTALLAAATLMAASTSAIAAEVGLLGSWGSAGNAPGQLATINDLATDAQGDVYVLGRSDGRVQRFAPDGTLRAGWTAIDPRAERFQVGDLSVAANGDAFVTDHGSRSTKVFDRDGTLLRTLAGPDGPLAVDAAGARIYLASAGGVHAIDAQTGAWLGESWEVDPDRSGGPDDVQPVPDDIVVGPGGDVHVLTAGRVATFGPDGTLRARFDVPGGDPGFPRPALAVTADGDLYVMTSAEPTFGTLKRMSADGTMLQELRRCAGHLGYPSGVAAGPGGVIYGAFGPRIDRFGPGGATPFSAEVPACGLRPPPPLPPFPPGQPPRAADPEPPGPTPPPGRVGVSIDAGARYANHPDVTLRVVWPRGARTMLIADDGSFTRARTLPVAASAPWRLDASGSERQPKKVHVRFGNDARTFTDTIVLDVTAPLVRAAALVRGAANASAARTSRPSRKRGFSVRLRATDGASGVASVQLAVSTRRPLKVQRYARSVAVRGTAAPRFVRALDRAGNVSRWRTIAQPPRTSER